MAIAIADDRDRHDETEQEFRDPVDAIEQSVRERSSPPDGCDTSCLWLCPFGATLGGPIHVRLAARRDPGRRVMLIATIRPAGDEIVIGSARYIGHNAADGPRVAEIAFTVEEDYRGFGIARRLLAHLTVIARESGIGRFEADVLVATHRCWRSSRTAACGCGSGAKRDAGRCSGHRIGSRSKHRRDERTAPHAVTDHLPKTAALHIRDPRERG